VYPENYKGHPQLVKDDENGLPLLELGKFYKKIASTHLSEDNWCLKQTWQRHPPFLFIGRDPGSSKQCYPGLSESSFPSMFPYFGFCCHWFGKRYSDHQANYILELLPEEQEIFTRFYKRINQDRHPNDFKAERVKSREDGKPDLKPGEIYFVRSTGNCKGPTGYQRASLRGDSIWLSELTWYKIGGHNFAGSYVTFDGDHEVYRPPLWVRHAYHHLAKDLLAANTPHKLSWAYYKVWSFEEGKL